MLDAIRRLPEAYRETLVLRLVEGMTGPEIAEQHRPDTGFRASQPLSRDETAARGTRGRETHERLFVGP